ncbi:MAG TPA: ATPase domain-containing protein [Thermomicrobiales bacterium]|nr:ATPase domain-containing protein [Thermomicrobiales bacterium]
MSERPRVPIALLPTGVPGLDEVLGGGLPEYSFNLIMGTPGAGKTTLAHQLMFALAAPGRPALYCTVLGEPPIKMLRYQQQLDFFDPTRVGADIRFMDLADAVLEQDLDAVLARIVGEVEATGPGLVIVDSFHGIVRAATGRDPSGLSLQGFVQRLALHLTTWQATTFLVGEYAADELSGNPVFTVADGILWLSQNVARNSVVRTLRVVKSRGQASMPGLHTFRITRAGLQVFPRMSLPRAAAGAPPAAAESPGGRLATGVAGLDALLGGGLPAGDAVIVTGPSGAGKSVLAAQFIAEGARGGEPGVIAVFEEHPRAYLRRAGTFGLDLEALLRRGALEIIYLRPLDLSPDEMLAEIRAAVARIGARRVVIDSVSGFELALAPAFREDFRESLYRLVGALTGTGVTVLLTMELAHPADDPHLSPYLISFLADDILLLHYAERAGELRKSLAVVKMRNSDHSKELRRYEITGQGLIVRERLADAGGAGSAGQPGLTDRELTVLRALIELGEAPAAALAGRTGLAEGDLAAALDRLVSLTYTVRVEGAAGGVYRALARPLAEEEGRR